MELIRQFLGESLIYSLLSLILAVGLTFLSIPLLNRLTGQFVTLKDLGYSDLILLILTITVLTGIVSGSYPALFLSGLQPNHVLKGQLRSGGKGALFRKILVITQFSISIILIISTIILGRQLSFIRNKPLAIITLNASCRQGIYLGGIIRSFLGVTSDKSQGNVAFYT